MDAALACFTTHGYAATRMEDVAARAGVSKAALYLYFRSKKALFTAVVREAVVPLVEHGERLLAEHRGPSADLLRRIIGDAWPRMANTPAGGLCRVLMAEVGRFPALARLYLDEVVIRARRLHIAILRRGIAAGEFRPDLDLDLAARLLIGNVVFASLWRGSFHPYDRCDLDALIVAHLDLYLRGIAA